MKELDKILFKYKDAILTDEIEHIQKVYYDIMCKRNIVLYGRLVTCEILEEIVSCIDSIDSVKIKLIVNWENRVV